MTEPPLIPRASATGRTLEIADHFAHGSPVLVAALRRLRADPNTMGLIKAGRCRVECNLDSWTGAIRIRVLELLSEHREYEDDLVPDDDVPDDTDDEGAHEYVLMVKTRWRVLMDVTQGPRAALGFEDPPGRPYIGPPTN